MPDASNRAVFESSVARYFYSTIQEFKRIDTGAIAALGTSTSWHLPQFAWVGAGDGVRLGIADSGIDLSRAQVTLESFRSFDYGNGAITGSTPKDYASTWHGSQVTSFACGHHEGVAPEASCCVAAVLTENNGRNGSVVQIAAGLDWLGRQGVDVVNCSFGSDEYDPAWYQMIVNLRALGVVVVAGIGNEGVPLFPGCFHNVVAVGARDSSGNNASWSATGPAVDGYGNELPRMKPDLWLPGVDLEGQVRDGLVTGTSYASPLATGALATRLLVQAIADLLGVDPERVDPDLSLMDLGLDSLMAVEFGVSLRELTGVELRTELITSGSSLRECAQSIVAELPGAQTAEQERR